MTATVEPTIPVVLAELEVVNVDRLSPSFVRVTFASAALADVGVDGPTWDQRFKLVVPSASGGLTSVHDADETWLTTWLDRPVEERGHMRTYTIRSLTGAGDDARLVVDFALHPGFSGPGGDWAAAAEPGCRVVAVLPRRGVAFGGIEFANPPGADLLLVGEESAVPAICAILEQLPDDARGSAFLEVPVAADFQAVRRPPGVSMTWLAREARPHGEALHEAVLAHLGSAPTSVPDEVEIDPDLWETSTWSSSGENVDTDSTRPDRPGSLASLQAWIAGEAAMVTRLRRHLVTELGIDREQVAFMGYWRRGVAMKS